MTWRRDMDTSTVPRDQGLPTAWPMKERRDRNNGNTFFFGNNFDFLFHPEIFFALYHTQRNDFFPPQSFCCDFLFSSPLFRMSFWWGFSTKRFGTSSQCKVSIICSLFFHSIVYIFSSSPSLHFFLHISSLLSSYP